MTTFSRVARVRGAEEQRGERVPDQDEDVLRGEGSAAAGVAVAPVDGVQLSLRTGAVLLAAQLQRRQIQKRQEDLHQRQVRGV